MVRNDRGENQNLPPEVRNLSSGARSELCRALRNLAEAGVEKLEDIPKVRDATNLVPDLPLATGSIALLLDSMDAQNRAPPQSKDECRDGGIGRAQDWPISGDDHAHDFFFISRHHFLALDAWDPLPRCQTFREKGLLEAKRITLKHAFNCSLKGSHAVVSYRWEAKHHPDASRARLRSLQSLLRRRPEIKSLWLDWICAPQDNGGPPRSAAELAYFKRTLQMVNYLYLGLTVIVLYDSQYAGRFWPNMECFFAQQRVTQGGIEPEDPARSRMEVRTIGSASGTDEEAREMLQRICGNQPVEAVLERMKNPDILVTNQSDKDEQLARLSMQSRTFARQFQDMLGKSREASFRRALMSELVDRSVHVRVASGWPADAGSVEGAIDLLAQEVRADAPTPASPSWIFAACAEAADPERLLAALGRHFPETRAVHCATSAQGVTTSAGFGSRTSEHGESLHLGLLAVYDPLGAYVTTSLALSSTGSWSEDPVQTLDVAYFKLRGASLDAMRSSAVDGKKIPGPEPLANNLHIWMSSLPGLEGMALDAIAAWGHRRFNRSVPVTGGTAADSFISGHWFTFCKQSNGEHKYFGGGSQVLGVVITLISASVQVIPCFAHPYVPVAEASAKVVSCGDTIYPSADECRGRVIHTLKEKGGTPVPAAALYRRWCEEHVMKDLMPAPRAQLNFGDFQTDVLRASAICPLGVWATRDGGSACDRGRAVCPLHPASFAYAEGGAPEDACVKLFGEVEQGASELVLLKPAERGLTLDQRLHSGGGFSYSEVGDILSGVETLQEQLCHRLDGSIGDPSANSVASSSNSPRARLAGVVMTYCAGLVQAMNAESRRRLGVQLSDCCEGRPFLAYHPFGEQGFVPTEQMNWHCNLSFSALAFSKDPASALGDGRSFSQTFRSIIKLLGVQGANQLVREVCMKSKNDPDKLFPRDAWEYAVAHANRDVKDGVAWDELGESKYEPTRKEVEQYAEWLGMDLKRERRLLWIAEEGLKAPLPKQWKPCLTDDAELVYLNLETGARMRNHPCSTRCLELYQERKAQGTICCAAT